MLEKAKKKLKDEMDKKKQNAYVRVVGQFLINHIEAHPAAAEKIMQKDKTIIGSLDEMRKVAMQRKTDNVAVLSDQEGFDVVLKYFGIEGKADTSQAVQPTPPEPTEADLTINISLGR